MQIERRLLQRQPRALFTVWANFSTVPTVYRMSNTVASRGEEVGHLGKQGFHEELTTYIKTERDRIYRLAFSYMGNEQDALDVVQTAVVRALSAPPIREPRYLKTWVYRIVVNTAIDGLRARNKYVPSGDWTFAEGASDPPRDDGLEVRAALDKLPPDLRAIVILRYFYELTLQEVAEVLSVNLNTVKTRLYRALRLLSVEMEDDDA